MRYYCHLSIFSVFALLLAPRFAGSDVSPAILYPTGDPEINYIDTIVVTYESSWSGGTNLSCNCQQIANASNIAWMWPPNPVPSNGSIVFPSLGTLIFKYLLEFPANCWFNLYPNVPDDGQGVAGGNFTLIYASGPETTWQAYAGATLPPMPTGSPATTSTTALSSHVASSGLSTGAKAGIGVGVGLCGLLLLGAFLYILQLRRKIARAGKQTSYSQATESGGRGQGQGQGAVAYEKYPSSGPVYEKSSEPIWTSGGVERAAAAAMMMNPHRSSQIY